MIKVNHANYDMAHEELIAGRWLVDPLLGLCSPDGRVAGCLNTSGYLRVRFTRGGRISVLSHRVVWRHFHGAIPDGRYINHLDGNKTNNAIANLELVTHSANMTHAHQTGLMEPAYAARRVVDDETARQIYVEAWTSGETASALAARYAVPKVTIKSIKYRRAHRAATACVSDLPMEGNRRSGTTISPSIIRDVRLRVARGESHTQVAEVTGVSRTYVRQLAQGEWRKAG